MILAVVTDDDGGLTFHERRQSRDRVLRRKLAELSEGRLLWMNAYTAGPFDPFPENAVISDTFLKDAGPDDVCFAENEALLPYAGRIRAVWLFRWNRRYPSDRKLDFIPSEHGMHLVSSGDFPGYSHEKITLEVWTR